MKGSTPTSVKGFAKAFEKVERKNRNNILIMGAIWDAIYSRHWCMSLINVAEWQELIASISQSLSVPSIDINVILRDFLEALAEEGILFPAANRAIKDLTGTNVINTIMFRSYDDLATLIQSNVNDYGNGSLPNEEYHWCFTQLSLIWMGVPFAVTPKLLNSDVSIEGNTITVTHDGATWSLTSEKAVQFFQYTMSAKSIYKEIAYGDGDDISEESLIRCRLPRLHQKSAALYKYIEEHSDRTLDSLIVQRCGTYWRAAQEMKNRGIDTIPVGQKAFCELLGMEPGISVTKYRKWKNEFISWYEVYGNKV